MSEKPKLSVAPFCLCVRILGNLAVAILPLIFAYGWAQAGDGMEGALVVGVQGKGVLLMELDGSNARTLTDISARSVAWSPDSRHIALAASDLFVIAYDGLNLN